MYVYVCTCRGEGVKKKEKPVVNLAFYNKGNNIHHRLRECEHALMQRRGGGLGPSCFTLNSSQ